MKQYIITTYMQNLSLEALRMKRLHVELVIFIGVWLFLAMFMITVNIYMYEFIYFTGCN